MAVLKCKMCGGDLLLDQSRTVGACQSCGSTMTLPSEADERRVNLFNRANHFRRNNDFDKAAGIYESILNDDSREPEAYWGLVLCKYGIEYVEDPTTHKRVPTCHRTQFGSILADPDYKAALEYADSSAKSVYESEAKVIDEIQKRILEISAKEEPFDVFICYKETNEAGTRTKDSVLAQDLYFALKKEGLRVFFSRISLEDKLGTEYEPYIFAALNSARVMVVIGTKVEYITSPWVRNEWSRFLSLMAKDLKKILIPAYRDMDAYELPDEFSHLQALDMGKLGFMQDLVRGIEKSLNTEKAKPKEGDQPLTGQYSPSANSLLDRAFICLEDKDWVKADELLEQVLNIEPRNPHAYTGKLMTKLKVSKESDLGRVNFPIADDNYFQKAVRFADESYQKVLQGYQQSILDRKELAQKEKIYQEGLAKKRVASTVNPLEISMALFNQIRGYKDADTLIVACKNQIENIKERMYRDATQLKASSKTQADFSRASERFKELKDYKDSAILADECITLGKEVVYQLGLLQLERSKTIVDFQQSAEFLNQMSGYKDADLLRNQALESREKLIAEDKANKKVAILIALGLIAFLLLMLVVFTLVIPSNKYSSANKLLEMGKYTEAMDAFVNLGDFKDSVELSRSAYYQHAQTLMTAGNFTEAADVFINLGYYKDSPEMVKKIYYQQAQMLFTAGNFPEAAAVFINLGDYEDSPEKARSAYYQHAQMLMTAGNFTEAADVFNKLGDYEDSQELARRVYYQQAQDLLDAGEHRLALPKLLRSIPYAGSILHYQRLGGVLLSAGWGHTVGLKSDGTVIAVGNNIYGQLNVNDWENIIAISAGWYHTVGLKSDGTVLAVGSNKSGQLNVDGWQNIIAVSAGERHTVGLNSDGSVVAVGSNGSGQPNVDGWQNIIAVSAGESHTVGLKSDGTVVAVGSNGSGQLNVDGWQNIIAVSAGAYHTVGLKSDGTVVAVGSNASGQLNVDDWQDIIAVSTGGRHTLGLHADGTVVAVGSDASRQLNVNDWENIIVVSAGDRHTVGLHADGTVVAVGANSDWALMLERWNLFQ